MSEELSWRSLFVFEGSEELSQRVAEYILKKSNEAIQQRGKFSVAFSGGSLPSLVASFVVFLLLVFSIFFSIFL